MLSPSERNARGEAKLIDFDHRCTERDCCHFDQLTWCVACTCKKSREQMMLKEINRLRDALEIAEGR